MELQKEQLLPLESSLMLLDRIMRLYGWTPEHEDPWTDAYAAYEAELVRRTAAVETVASCGTACEIVA